MPLSEPQILLGRNLLSELLPSVAQELEFLLKFAAANKKDHTAIYEDWERESARVGEIDDDFEYPLSYFLRKLYCQKRLPGLLDTLQQLVVQGIPPTFNEFSELVQKISRRSWLFSKTELRIIKYIHKHPTASIKEIAGSTKYNRKTVRNHVYQLYWGYQLLPYPSINYHALGLRHFQFWFRGTMKTPSSAYFFSRLSLLGHNLESGWLIDTWKVPMGQEDILVEHYRRVERQSVIQELKVRELFSLGRHLSLAAYGPEIGWQIDPDVFRLTLERALEGQKTFIPQHIELMVYDATNTPKYDAIDRQIVGILIDDYLLYQSKEGIASQLGISRSNFSRRLHRLESTGVIKPMLNLRVTDLVQTVIRIPETEPQVLNALMSLPEVFFSTIEIEKKHREWLVSVKSAPAIAEIIMQSTWPDGIPLKSYGAQRVAFQSQRKLFASYDAKEDKWPPIFQ